MNKKLLSDAIPLMLIGLLYPLLLTFLNSTPEAWNSYSFMHKLVLYILYIPCIFGFLVEKLFSFNSEIFYLISILFAQAIGYLGIACLIGKLSKGKNTQNESGGRP